MAYRGFGGFVLLSQIRHFVDPLNLHPLKHDPSVSLTHRSHGSHGSHKIHQIRLTRSHACIPGWVLVRVSDQIVTY